MGILTLLFLSLWYTTERFIDRFVDRQVTFFKEHNILVHFTRPLLRGFSWKFPGHYRHYTKIHFQRDGKVFLTIPMCTLRTNWSFFWKKKLYFEFRGTTRAHVGHLFYFLEKTQGVCTISKEKWTLQLLNKSLKILAGKQFIICFQNNRVTLTPVKDKYATHLTTTFTLSPQVLENTPMHGKLDINGLWQEGRERDTLLIQNYRVSSAGTALSGRGHVTWHQGHFSGWFNAKLKGWDYKLSLLLYLLSLQFRKNSEIQRLTSHLTSDGFDPNKTLTFLFDTHNFKLKEFPFIHFRF